MDFRSTKAFDYVSATRNLTTNVEKIKSAQIKWFHDYLWLCDQYRDLEKRLDKLCKEKVKREITSKQIDDERTCLPFPKTTNDSYGWLSRRKEFQLQIYGRDMIKYPSPMDDIVLLGGAVPTLAGGKGFF